MLALITIIFLLLVVAATRIAEDITTKYKRGRR